MLWSLASNRRQFDMKHTGYFLITPRQGLVDLVNKLARGSLSDLTDPVMWSGSEFDRGILQPQDYELLVKLLFVDTLIREQSSKEEFGLVFKDITRSVESFDLFWVLKRIHLDMLADDALDDALVGGSISEIQPPNSRIEAVLRQAVAKAKS